MSVLGNRVIRKEDPRLLTGAGRYVDSITLDGARRVTFVRSTVAHAAFTVDVTRAREAPGVVDVVTAAEVDLAPLPPPAFFPHLDARFLRPVLADGVVRFVGEPIAAIVSDDRSTGADAAELVVVDYEPRPTLVDLEASARGDHLLFPDIGTNAVAEMSLPPVEGLFDDAEVVVRQRMVNRRVAPVPMEPRTCAASWNGSRLTYYASTQGTAVLKETLAQVLGLPVDAVRVVCADVGGGFGAKGLPYPEDLVVAWLAVRLGGVVRWAETRTENLTAMTHGRGQVQDVEIGATRDGRIVGLRVGVMQESGAYPDVGAGLPALTLVMASGVYAIPRIGFTSTAYLTNTTPTGAFRGAGRPEATYALERVVDVLADEMGMDPAELRRRNLIPATAFPATTAVGTVYDTGDYATALDRALAAAGYEELRAEQARRRASGDVRQLGIGVACYVEITGGMPGLEPASVTVHADGTATVVTASTPHGQGHETAWAMVASDRLGIPIEHIDVVYGDTDRVPAGPNTGGSRSAQVCGAVVGQAADRVVEQGRAAAGALLEAAIEDIRLDTATGRFHVAGAPSITRTWAEVVAAGTGELSADETFESTPTFPFGAHVGVVEVDTETGRVELRRLVGCDDAGRVLNPLLFEGQVHGGMAQGVGQALLEEIAYDADGNPLTPTLADYAAVSACELPSFELVPNETPTPYNALGAKGIGESGTIGSTPCVVNAVVDALSHLGVRHIDMPTTPQRVWEAIRAAAR